MHVWTSHLDGATWIDEGDAPSSPDLVLYFGSTDSVATGQAYASLRERFPDALIAGGSTGSTILGTRVDDDTTVSVAMRFERARVRGATEPIRDAQDSAACGARLAAALAAPDLTGVFVLSDGLAVNGTELVRGMVTVLGEKVSLSGGLAGDGARFERTLVGLQEAPTDHRVAAIGFYGDSLRMGLAAAGGWDTFGPPRAITRSECNVLYELDGKPALDLYERYLGEEAEGLPGTALLYPLQIWPPENPDASVVRTVLAVDREARTMTFAGAIPQGWQAQLMRGVHENLVSGAADAALAAVSRHAPARGSSPRVALLVSCVGRRLLMGQRTTDEVEAVHEEFGEGIAQVGFYSYGEIAPHERVGSCELHNQTMTVTLIEEAVA
ncbi:MAG: FIST N-terminal domain-containing protein [Burkholderiaceae bacterium]